MELNTYAKYIFEHDAIELFPDEIDTFEKLIEELHINISDALSDFYSEKSEDVIYCLLNCAINILYYFGGAEIDVDATIGESKAMRIDKNAAMEFPEFAANIHYLISYAKLLNGSSEDDSIQFLCAAVGMIAERLDRNGIDFISELKNSIEENETDSE